VFNIIYYIYYSYYEVTAERRQVRWLTGIRHLPQQHTSTSMLRIKPLLPRRVLNNTSR